MKLMKVEIEANTYVNTFFALESMKLKTSANKKKYLELRLSDFSGKIKGYVWNSPELMAEVLKEKSIIAAEGDAILYNGSLILNVQIVRQAKKKEYDLNDFAGEVIEGVPYWQGRLTELVEEVKSADCRRIIESFLEDKDFETLFMEAPESASSQYGYIGGLLKHTVIIMSQALVTSKNYHRRFNQDLLMTGAFLHDIGKIRGLYWEVGCGYTASGKLMGHIGLGLMLLDEQLSEMKDIPEELAILLRHMILSHHGETALGNPVKPAIQEAVILYMLETTNAALDDVRKSTPDDIWCVHDKFTNPEIAKIIYAKSGEQIAAEVQV